MASPPAVGGPRALNTLEKRAVTGLEGRGSAGGLSGRGGLYNSAGGDSAVSSPCPLRPAFLRRGLQKPPWKN